MNQANSESIAISPVSLLEEVHCMEDSSGFCQTGLFRFGILMIFAFYAPVILIWSDIIPFRYRFHASIVLLSVFIFYSFLRRHGFRELGFRTDNLKDSILWNLVFMVIGAAGLFITYRAGFLRSGNDHLLPYIYVIYILSLITKKRWQYILFLMI